MEQTNKQSGRIIAIIAMMFIYAMISFVTNLAAPIGVIWKNQPELMGSNTLGMMGNMMNFLAYLFMGIPAGKLLIKIGYKKTAMVAIAVGFVGVLVQYLSGFPTGLTGFWVYLLGAFVCGFSVCMLNTVVNPHAQPPWRRRQPWQPAQPYRRNAQLACRNADTYAGGRLGRYSY